MRRTDSLESSTAAVNRVRCAVEACCESAWSLSRSSTAWGSSTTSVPPGPSQIQYWCARSPKNRSEAKYPGGGALHRVIDAAIADVAAVHQGVEAARVGESEFGRGDPAVHAHSQAALVDGQQVRVNFASQRGGDALFRVFGGRRGEQGSAVVL